MFACDYILHRGHRGMPVFSVSCASIKIKISLILPIPWRYSPHLIWPLHTIIYMFACILLNPTHVQVILWNPQVKMSRNQFFRATSRPEERFPLFSHPFSHCPCAWSRIMTLHLIMSLHQREREPMRPVQCACKHDICSVICDPNSTLWAQLLSATRYVKNTLTW